MSHENENAAGKSGASNPIAERDKNKNSMKLTNMQVAALDFGGQGKPIFPCEPRGKRPLTSSGFKDASAEQGQINAWWAEWPDANIGLPTGQSSGFWVLDIDKGKDGEDSLRQLEERYGALPKTRQVATGGGGRHLFFLWPETGEVCNSVGKLGSGIDVRGKGGYVIAPPSIHASGQVYRWNGDEPILSAPAWLLSLIQKHEDQRVPTTLTEWRAILRHAREGCRNDTIARLAGKLLHVGLDPFMTLELCHAFNEARCNPPLSSEEVHRTVNSIAGLEIKQRNKKNG